MGEKKYSRDGARFRFSSPNSRDLNPSKHRQYSPRHRMQKYVREGDRSRMIEEKGNFDRGFDSRAGKCVDYDEIVRDRYGVGVRRSRSPRMVDRKGVYDRNVSTQTVGHSYYDAGGRNGVRDGLGQSRRLYDKHALRVDSSSSKFPRDHHLDGPEKSYGENVKDYSYASDYLAGETNVGKGVGETDYYSRSRYPNGGQPGPLSMSKYANGSKQVLLDEREERMHFDSYTLDNHGVGDIPKSTLNGGEFKSHVASAASQRYMNSNTDRQGYFLSQNELLLDKKDGAHRGGEELYLQKNECGFHFRDDGRNLDKMGIERLVGRDKYKYKKEDNPLSSHDDILVPSYKRTDYISMSPGTFRVNSPGHPTAEEIPRHSQVIQPRSALASERIHYNGYSEKRRNMSPVRPGGQIDDVVSYSRSYLGLPEGKRDNLYAEFGRGKVDRMGTRPTDIEEYGEKPLSRIGVLDPILDELSHQNHVVDDKSWDPYPSSRRRLTLDKFIACESSRTRERDMDMLGSGSLPLDYGTEVYRGYGRMEPRERHTEVNGGSWSRSEGSDVVRAREYEPPFGRLYDSPRKGFASTDFSLGELSGKMPEHKHVREEAFARGAEIYSQVDGGGESDLLSLSRKYKISKCTYGNTSMSSNQMSNCQPSPAKFIPSRPRYHHESGSRDVKRRLGPVPQKLPVKQRLGKRFKPPIKKRLGPTHP